MVILGIESATPVASAALISGDQLLGEVTLNIGLTHSEQLLPLIDELLHQTKIARTALEGIAVSSGPGSFTGLRIGMATAKGLAQGLKLPLVSVPTLLALAFLQGGGHPGLVSPVLNARRSEVYTALFRFAGDQYEQLEPYQAISPQDWAQKLKDYREPVLFAGDGTAYYQEIWQESLGVSAVFPPLFFHLTRGASVAWLGRQRILKGEQDDLFALKPMYIRSSEAQRKLAEVKKSKKS